MEHLLLLADMRLTVPPLIVLAFTCHLYMLLGYHLGDAACLLHCSHSANRPHFLESFALMNEISTVMMSFALPTVSRAVVTAALEGLERQLLCQRAAVVSIAALLFCCLLAFEELSLHWTAARQATPVP